jgi:hypothetical protein
VDGGLSVATGQVARPDLGVPAGPISASKPDRLVATMLPLDAAHGLNFLTDDILKAVNDRLAEGQHSGIVSEDRLFRNLLSSQPACFNLFGPFVTDPSPLLGWVRTIDPEAASVQTVRFEWAPDRRQHFDGGSAFDAFVEYRAPGRRFIGVECKYAENLSVCGIKVRDIYRTFTEGSSEWCPQAADRLTTPRLCQFWLNTLLAQSLDHKDQRWERGTVAVIACQSDLAAAAATNDVRNELVNPDRWLSWSPYEAVLDAIDGNDSWADQFRRRYLDFTLVSHLLPPGDPRLIAPLATASEPSDELPEAEREGMWVTAHPDGTIDIENVVPPDLEAEYLEYERYLDSLTDSPE